MALTQTVSAITLLLMSSLAVAQQDNPVRVRGTIENKDHQLLHVKTRDGQTLKMKLADNAHQCAPSLEHRSATSSLVPLLVLQQCRSPMAHKRQSRQGLALKYKDGEKTFEVPPNVTVVTFAAATDADLKPGEKVFSAAAKKLPDGTMEVANITVGRNGINPPM